MANMMRFLALHVDLLLHTKGVCHDRGIIKGDEAIAANIARKSLHLVSQRMCFEARFICRTVCGMVAERIVEKTIQEPDQATTASSHRSTRRALTLGK
jgi:hypothetical protein